MFFLPILIGAALGVLLFAFVFIASKKSGRIYLAPLVIFAAAVVLFFYGLLIVRGFEGMAYWLLAFGFLLADIIATLLLPIIVRKWPAKKRQFSKMDVWGLFTMPLAACIIIILINIDYQPYWIIEKGTELPDESASSHYQVSTISEGKKQISINLDKQYLGKFIQVKKVKQHGNTIVILKIESNGEPGKTPFLKMGVDEIHDPLTVQTTEGQMIAPR